MTLDQLSKKGARAQELLNNEIFSESMSNLRAAVIAKWQKCELKDRETAHELLMMIKLMDGLEQNIRKFVTDGKAAVFEIERQSKQDELKRKTSRFS